MGDDTPTISVPLKWILNEPIQIRESITYEDDPETVPSIIKHFRLKEDMVEVEFYAYHGWLEVMVIRQRYGKEILGAYLLIERDEYYAWDEGEMAQMVAQALVRFAVCETTY